jgi:putative inorganic carbon (HCO3(-)) transporter
MIHFGLEAYAPLLLYIGMFGAFLASMFWRPSVGIYLLALTLPLQTGRYTIQTLPLGAQFIDILLLGTILGLLIQKKSVVPKSNLTMLLALFAVFCYFSLWEGSFFLNAPLPLWIGDERFAAWKNYVEMFLFALVVASTIREKSQVRLLLVCMAVSVLIVNRSYYSTLSGRDLSQFSYQVRDAGPLGYAGVNGLAAFEAMVASFLLGTFSFAKKIYGKIGILLLVATCCYCILFSFSRGAYLGVIVGLVTVGLLRSRWMLAVAAVIVLGWQLLLPVAVQQRITMTTEDAEEGQQFDSSSQQRIELWEDAMNLFKRNPITGTGFETYSHMGRVGNFRDTHNYYVKVLAEMGIIGLALYLLLLGKIFWSGVRLFYDSSDPFWRAVGLGFVALLASVFIMNLFGDRWMYQQVDGYLWILLGCVIRGLIVLHEPPAQAEAANPEPASPAPEGQLATV